MRELESELSKQSRQLSQDSAKVRELKSQLREKSQKLTKESSPFSGKLQLQYLEYFKNKASMK